MKITEKVLEDEESKKSLRKKNGCVQMITSEKKRNKIQKGKDIQDRIEMVV